MARIEQIPIILLTGFLGSGKTTLLANWLKAPNLDGAMVIVNELGEVGLDHRLLTSSSDMPLLLDNGCACCAAQDDLVSTLERLFWDRLHKRIPRFNWVLIETTGVADPLPIIDAFRRHALINERYRVAGVVTALDAKRGLARLSEFPECRNQLLAANAVIVTKTDIASAAELAHVRSQLPDLAPHARVMTSANGNLPAGELLSVLAACATCGSHAHEAGHHDHDHAHGDHDPHDDHSTHNGDRVEAEHAGGVNTAFLPLPKPVSWLALIGALDTLMEGHSNSLLRLKGIVRLDGAPGYHAVQGIPGQGLTRAEVPIEPADEPPRTGFTLIAIHEPAAGIASSLDALIAIRTARLPASAADAGVTSGGTGS